MPLLAVTDATAVDAAPVWLTTPDVSFVDSTAGTYDLAQHVSETCTYSLNGSSAALPTGVTLGSNGVLTATTSVATGTTAGILVDADDGVNSAVTSPSFTITVTATSEPNATITVASSGGDYTHAQLQAALDAASAGDVVEIEANSPGGTVNIDVALTLTTSGNATDVITLRGRAGDTVILYVSSDSNVLTAGNQSYWYFKNLQFGRDETLNGWEYTTTDSSKGRFGVEHNACVWADNETSHHIVFDSCRFYGGNAYDAVYADIGTEYWGAINCTVTHCGVNVESSTPDFGANGIHFRGKHSFQQDNLAQYVGHNGLQMEGAYSVFLRNICEGDWSAYNTNTGNRTMAVVGDKGPSPYGPILSEGNICRGAKPEAGSGDPSPATKFHSYRGITRRNFIFDNTDQAIQWAPQSSSGIAAMNYNRVYHNTFYNCGWLESSTDAGLGSAWNGNGIEAVWKNNIVDSMGAGRSGDSTHFRWVRNNSTDGAYSNGWRGLVFDTNTLNTSSAGNEKVRLIGTGASSETGVTAIEAQWTEFTNNSATAQTFLSIGDRTSDTWATVAAGFEVQSGSAAGNAAALTQADGAGTDSTILDVDDALYFVALNDPATWDLGWFSQFGFDVRDDYIYINSTVVQVSAVNYGTNRITLASSASWSDNDTIALVDHNGIRVLNDIGADP